MVIVWRDDCQLRFVLYCVPQLYTVLCTHIHALTLYEQLLQMPFDKFLDVMSYCVISSLGSASLC